MKKLICVLCTALMLFALPACSGEGNKIVLNVYNWGEYIDESVLGDFEEKYPDIKVNYETYADNETMYTKIKNGSASYDVLIPSDYMIERLIDEDMLEKLDFSNIPNYSHIDSKFLNLEYDPNNEYSVPYMWGVLGILYDTTKVSEETFTWGTLFDSEYEHNVLMKTDMRDMLGIALKSLGYSMNSTDEGELEKAKEKLLSQKNNVLARVGDEGMDKMIAGEAALSLMYSGDGAYCISENPNLDFAIPEDGTNFFVDAMVIPKSAKNKKAAELFINFMCETETALRNAEEIGYSTPHTGAYALLDPEVKTSFAYPDEDILEDAEVYIYLKDKTELYDRIWREFITSI